MTTSSEEPAGDAFWRRPAMPPDEAAPRSMATGRTGNPTTWPEAEDSLYPGPPVGAPPPAGWRPPVHVQPPPPRPLPAQDHARLDAEERGARNVTYGVAMIAAAVLIVVVCLLCSRIVF